MAELHNNDLDFFKNDLGNEFAQGLQSTNKKEHQLPLNDDFAALWEVSTSERPEPKQTTDPVSIIQEQRDEILLLKDQLIMMQEENSQLRKEMGHYIQHHAQAAKLQSNYDSLLELNRNLTKKLNNIMQMHEEKCSKLQEIKDLLA